MRIGVAGGGPGGLYFAALMKGLDPAHEITVWERNAPDDTFGFGVVFSDRTLAGIHEADPVLREALAAHGRHWDTIEVRLKGERIRCGGNGMAAIVRRTLLMLLQDSARDAGADALAKFARGRRALRRIGQNALKADVRLRRLGSVRVHPHRCPGRRRPDRAVEGERLGHIAERMLQRMQDYQRGAFYLGVFGDDFGAARRIPRFECRHYSRSRSGG